MIIKRVFINVGLLVVIGFCYSGVFSQSNKSAPSKPPPIPSPGKIQLPEGYIYERRKGIDSSVGAFIRKDGFEIKHDIGGMAANYADKYFPEHFARLRKQTHLNSTSIEQEIKYLQDQIEWRQRQTVNGVDVMVVLLKDSTLIASFAEVDANFVAKVDTSDKVADFFLIVLTYQPKVNKEK